MDTPLNKAHIYARKAMSLFGKSESKELLEKVIHNLTLAKSLSSSQHAIESIQIQKTFYEKQLNVLNIKTTLHDKYRDPQKEDTTKIKQNEHIENVTNLQHDLLNNVSLTEKAIDDLMKTNVDLSELQQLNTQFGVLLCKLFNLVDETLRENVTLRERRQDEIKLSPCDVESQATKDNETTTFDVHSQRLSDESSEEEINDLPPLECPDFDLDK